MDDQKIKKLVDEIIILFGMSFGLFYKLSDEKFNKYYLETFFDVSKIIDRIFEIFEFNKIKTCGNNKTLDKEIKDRIKTHFKENGIIFDGEEPNSQPEKSLAEYISKFNYNDPLRKDLIDLFKKYAVFYRSKLGALAKLRQEPLYIKIMGEYALYSLPSIIGKPFVSPLDYHIGYFFYYPNMTQDRFEMDVLKYEKLLKKWLQTEKIDANKHNCYMTMVDCFYNYYILCQKGGQIPIRPISQTNYEDMNDLIKKFERKGIFRVEDTSIDKMKYIQGVKNAELTLYLEELMRRPVKSDGCYASILPEPQKIKRYPNSVQK